MCNQFEETRAGLSRLVAAGTFKDDLDAITNLHSYSRRWKYMFNSMPMTAIIAWARGNIDMTVASRMVTILNNYTHRLNTECGFRYLPPFLQRQSHLFYGQTNPPDFRIITDGLTEGQVAHFPDSVDADEFTATTPTFGQVIRGNKSSKGNVQWYRCVVALHY